MIPVFDDQLAKHLGIHGLHVGAGRAEGAGGPRILAWWSVSVEPSFSRSWAIGALHEEEWTHGPDPDRITARGFVADRDGAAVARLEADEVLEALGRLNLFQLAPTHRMKVIGRELWLEAATLDGLGYSVRWGTRATRGRFRFSNPRFEWLEDFERVLFRFARRVITASGVGRFEEQLECWASYQASVRSIEPGASADRPRA